MRNRIKIRQQIRPDPAIQTLESARMSSFGGGWIIMRRIREMAEIVYPHMSIQSFETLCYPQQECRRLLCAHQPSPTLTTSLGETLPQPTAKEIHRPERRRRLIQHQLTAMVWRPLVELTRRRHLKFRERLANRAEVGTLRSGSVVSAGV